MSLLKYWITNLSKWRLFAEPLNCLVAAPGKHLEIVKGIYFLEPMDHKGLLNLDQLHVFQYKFKSQKYSNDQWSIPIYIQGIVHP